MESGTGIFLSAVFLGTVALFIATKDRWNWKKILLWPLAVVLGLSVIGGTIGYVYKQVEDRPEKETMLWGIPLGASPADVKFAKGQPSVKEDENTWRYLRGRNSRDDGSYVVNFKDGKVRYVYYDGTQLHGPTVSGISPYSTLRDIEEKLGQSSHVSRSKDELKRVYSFERFNIFFMFEKNEIVALGIYDPTTGPIKFPDEANREAGWGAMNDREELEVLRERERAFKAMTPEQKRAIRDAKDRLRMKEKGFAAAQPKPGFILDCEGQSIPTPPPGFILDCGGK